MVTMLPISKPACIPHRSNHFIPLHCLPRKRLLKRQHILLARELIIQTCDRIRLLLHTRPSQPRRRDRRRALKIHHHLPGVVSIQRHQRRPPREQRALVRVRPADRNKAKVPGVGLEDFQRAILPQGERGTSLACLQPPGGDESAQSASHGLSRNLHPSKHLGVPRLLAGPALPGIVTRRKIWLLLSSTRLCVCPRCDDAH